MKGAVSAPQPRAAEVGAQILADGGNAFDAAVAVAFAQMITDPWQCGIAGHGTALVKRAGEKAVVIEFSTLAGSRVREDMWAGQKRGRVPIGASVLFDDHRNELGHTSVCTPGTAAGLWEVHQLYCSKPWSELIQPAIQLAREGVGLGTFAYESLTKDPQDGLPEGRVRAATTPDCAKLFLDEYGNIKRPGTIIKNEDYANTLEAVAEGGADAFYKGDIARAIAADMDKHGGFVTFEDLAKYKVRRYEPISVNYRGNEVISVPPPVGGAILLQILNVLSGYDLSSLHHNGLTYLGLVSDALTMAHADRRKYMGDPDFVDVPVAMLLSDERAAQHRKVIDEGHVARDDNWDVDHQHTTHVSTYDAEGNCAAITHSLGTGSGVITPGLGFIYNNSMKLFNPEPGTPNSIKAGKARIRGSSPTIVMTDSQPRIVVGAPGGSVIISSVLQTILNIIDFDMTASEAVLAPRIHCEGGVVFAEARILSDVISGLRARGRSVDFLPDSFGQFMSAAHAIHIPPGGKRIQAGADPRRGSGIAFFDGEGKSTWGWDP